MTEIHHSTLAFQSAAKRLNRDLLFSEIASGKSILSAGPYCIQIEAINACNLSCSYCGRTGWSDRLRATSSFPIALLERLDPFLELSYEVVLGGYGEPFLHEEIWSLIESIIRRQCDLTIISNTTLLGCKDLQRLVDGNVHRITASVDTIHEQACRQLRGISAAEILHKLEFLANTKSKGGRSNPIISINAVANSLSIVGLPELVRRANSVGVTEITVTHQKIYAPDQESLSLFKSPEKAQSRIQEALTVARTVGVELTVPTFDSSAHPCMQPFESLFVLSDGSVLGCCSAIFADERFAFKIGKVSEQSIVELWNCRSIVDYRAATLDQGEYPKQCSRCAFRFDTLEAHHRFPGNR